MSKFSGKCDFYDEIEIHGLDQVLDSDIYIGRPGQKLELRCRADCVPYYPYIVCMSSWNNTEGRAIIYLTEKSWPDIEEERLGKRGAYDCYRRVLMEELDCAINKCGIYAE